MAVEFAVTALAERLVRFFAAAPSTYVVGGAVRDRLLGRPVHDFDLLVAKDALSLARRLADAVGGAYLTLDADFATARVLVGEDQIDVAQERGGSLEADLWLRDFTVNALAVPLREWLSDEPSVLDPTGGQADLTSRTIRAVSEGAFRQDPARLLRAPRLAAQLGGQIEATTEAWLVRDAALLRRTSAERLRDELWRCLTLPGTATILRQLDRLDLLTRFLPEVSQMQGVTQRPPHTLDVYDHTLAVSDNLEAILGALGLGGAPAEPTTSTALAPYRDNLRQHLLEEPVPGRPRWTLLKFAALMHDIGKPRTRTERDGVAHFYEHETVGAAMVHEIGQGLKLGTREIAWLALVVRQHLRPLYLAQQNPVSNRSIYRYFRDAADAAPGILLLSIADNRSKGDFEALGVASGADDRVLSVAVELLDLLYRQERPPVVTPPPLVNGHTLMQALNLPPGPQVGDLLERIREATALGEITTRVEALALAQRLLAKRAP